MINFTLAGATFKTVVLYVTNLIYMVIPILYVLCFITFFWGLTKFLINAENKEEINKGKSYMIWGVLALFVLISVRSILGILSKEFDLNPNIPKPLLPTSGQTTTDDRFINGVIPQINIKQ